MTQAIVFTAQAQATAYAGSVDSALGYPKAGLDIGPGIHAPPSQSATTHYADVMPNSTLPLWAYPYDATVQAEVSAVPVPVGAIRL